MILCICNQITEDEYREFSKNMSIHFDNDDLMIRIDSMGYSCGSCVERMMEIQKENKDD